MKNYLRILFVCLLVFSSQIVKAQMPAAISISPEDATAADELTLTLTPSLGCTPDGKESLEGLPVIGIHAGVTIGGELWQNVIPFDQNGGDGTESQLSPNGDGTYSITFTPNDYFNVSEGAVVTAINCVFNTDSGWDGENKDFDSATGDCTDYFIPLSFVNTNPVIKVGVNMNYYQQLGLFDPENGEYVSIIGDLTTDGNPLIDFDFDGIYDWTFENVVDGETYTFQFQIHKADGSFIVEEVNHSLTAQVGLIEDTFYFNDEVPTSYTISMDLNPQIDAGLFDPADGNISVSGEFNDFTELNLADVGDGIYEVTIDGLAPGLFSYAFELNGEPELDETFGLRLQQLVSGANYQLHYFNTMTILQVDMTPAVEAGIFDESQGDFVDVAGTFNNFGGSTPLLNNGSANIYETYIHNAQVGDTIEFKFRINGTWDSATAEFPDDPSGTFNRKFVPEQGVNYVSFVYDVQFPVGIDEVLALPTLHVYTNSVDEGLFIKQASDLQQISISNLNGQQVLTFNNSAAQADLQIDINQLANGLYIVNATDVNGKVFSSKFIK